MAPENIPIITDIEFDRIEPHKGHVGYIALTFAGSMRLKKIAVHKRLNPSDKLTYRVVYPHNESKETTLFHPTNPKVSRLVELEINSYVKNVLKN